MDKTATLQKIQFQRGATTLVGHLFAGAAAAPGIIVTGSWITVKEQMADLYARKLVGAGFTTLSFDFSNFGESAGEPRERENPAAKIADIAAAANWLSKRPEVTGEAVGGLAICASAGYMAHAIAAGAPIAAFTTVAAWLHDEGTVGQMYGGAEGVAARMRDGEEARTIYQRTAEVRYVPAYSDTDPKAAMGEMVRAYYGDPSIGAVPEWRNRFAVLSWPDWLTFNGLATAGAVTVPTLMIHSEQAAFPDNLRRFAAALSGKGEIVWRDGTQLDFYHAAAQVDPAVRNAVEHFRRFLI